MEIFSGVTFIVILLFSVIFHEVAHGLMADRLGDPTARYAGRLTLNPIPHIDPIGSILLPLLLYFSGLPILGAARPVPVDYRNFRDMKRDMFLVAAVGPMTNFVLAILTAIVYRLTPNLSEIGADLLFLTIQINLVLGIFNLLPFPPLDGSKILASILGYFNREWMHWFLELERFGFIIIIVILLIPGFLSAILLPPLTFMLRLLLGT